MNTSDRILPVLIIVTTNVFAQTAPSISGTVSASDGTAIKDVVIEITNTATGAIFRTTTDEDGKYSVASLPSGSYGVWTNPAGFRYFERRDLMIGGGQTLRLDIRVERFLNFGTPGDNPTEAVAALRARLTLPTGPSPRMPDGKPDLTGFWIQDAGTPRSEPALLPWASELFKERRRRDSVDSPVANCLPTKPPLSLMMKLVHTRELLVILVEDVIGFRQIYLDGRQHPEDVNPTWLGHSIGHWEDDTLVVETVGITDRSWLGPTGPPHTERLRIVERFRRASMGRLELETILEDSETFSEPWVIRNAWVLAPGEDLLEYVCENDRSRGHLER